jgi:hypothetical protein
LSRLQRFFTMRVMVKPLDFMAARAPQCRLLTAAIAMDKRAVTLVASSVAGVCGSSSGAQAVLASLSLRPAMQVMRPLACGLLLPHPPIERLNELCEVGYGDYRA